MVRVKKRSVCQYMVRCNHVNVAIGLRAGESSMPRVVKTHYFQLGGRVFASR